MDESLLLRERRLAERFDDGPRQHYLQSAKDLYRSFKVLARSKMESLTAFKMESLTAFIAVTCYSTKTFKLDLLIYVIIITTRSV